MPTRQVDPDELQRTMREIAGNKAEDIVMTAGLSDYEHGIEKGSKETLRESIAKVLRARFGEIPAVLNTAILDETDRERLDQLLELALRVGDLNEFLGANESVP